MASLGDILASTATGKDPDYAGIEAGAALKGAQFQDTMAQVPLRGAQTQEALAAADKARLEGIALSRKQYAIDHLAETLAAAGGDVNKTLGAAVASGSNFSEATAGTGHLQEQDLIHTLSDPHADPQTRLAASSGLTHKLESPFAKLDAETVNVTDPTLPGGAPNEHLSKIGEATIGQKDAAAGLANAKANQLVSTDTSIDPNEIAYHAHLANNDPTYRPNFGMGQSATRQAFLKAQWLDAAGYPINAETLGLKAGQVGSGFKQPGAAPAAGGTTAGGGGTATPNNPLDHNVPVDAPNPADNAPAALPGESKTVAFKPTDFGAPATAILPPMSPADAADMVAARRGDVKASQGALTKTTGQLALVQSFENTANRNFDLLMEYANKLDNTGSPLINKAINDWNQGIAGDKLTGQFVSTFQALHDEYAKILSGATGAQGATDAGNKRADEVFNRNMNLDTLKGLSDTIPREMANRRVGYVGVINTLHGNLAGKNTGLAGPAGDAAAADTKSAASAATIPPAAAAALKSGKVTHFGNGQSWTLGPDGKPVQVK